MSPDNSSKSGCLNTTNTIISIIVGFIAILGFLGITRFGSTPTPVTPEGDGVPPRPIATRGISTRVSTPAVSLFGGRWEGVLNQANGASYTVSLVLNDCQPDSMCGSSDYGWQGGNCGGKIYFHGIKEKGYFMSENITYGNDCVDDKFILYQIGGNSWGASYYYTNNVYMGEAVLRKTD